MLVRRIFDERFDLASLDLNSPKFGVICGQSTLSCECGSNQLRVVFAMLVGHENS